MCVCIYKVKELWVSFYQTPKRSYILKLIRYITSLILIYHPSDMNLDTKLSRDAFIPQNNLSYILEFIFYKVTEECCQFFFFLFYNLMAMSFIYIFKILIT